MLQQAKPFVDERQSKTFWFDIRNTDRSVGASLSGYIAQTHGDQGLAADPIKAYFNGTAGQSFGVWNAGGVELYLTLIGRTDLLKELDGFTAKQQKLALSKLLETAEPHPGKALYCTENNPPCDNGLLNAQFLQQAKPFVDERQSKTFWYDILNTERTEGASLSGYIAQTHGDQGLAADPIKAFFNGTAGQCFCVWNAGGVVVYLTGYANDYVLSPW